MLQLVSGTCFCRFVDIPPMISDPKGISQLAIAMIIMCICLVAIAAVVVYDMYRGKNAAL